MTEMQNPINSIASWLAGIVGAEIKKPFTDLQTDVKAIQKENKEQTEKLNSLFESVRLLDNDTADLLCSQLTREHDYYLRLGYCPASDKRRLDGVYTRYRARGRNHVAETYMQDIIALPEYDTKKGRTIYD